MFGMPRLASFDDVFNLHREVDRMFNQAWSDPTLRTPAHASPSIAFNVQSTEDGWRLDVPLAGIDPKDVKLDVAGNTLTIRIEASTDVNDAPTPRFEQSLVVPQFVDLEKLTATHHHGMLRIALPIRESVKPRRIEIQSFDEQKQLSGSAR